MENQKIIHWHTHLELNDYNLGDCPELERKLSIYDKIYYRFIPKGFVYDNERKALLIPAGVSARWVENLTGRPVEMKYTSDENDPMSIRLKAKPRNELQKEAIAFLAGEGQYRSYSKYGQMILNLDTGEGKTFTTIALMTVRRLKTIIILNSNKIKEQWVEKLQEYTDISPKAICEFNGSSKCTSIIKYPKKYSQYRVFITTHDTIRSFGNTYGWDQVHELFKSMRVGIKIYDEAHLEFQNIVKIDCYTDTKYTYYLTATFGRSNINENFVYNMCFKSIPKYEQRTKDEYDGKRYINYMAVFYKSNPTLLNINNLKNKYGFNRNAYASYQLVDDEFFFPMIRFLVELTVKKKEFKTLLLIATIEGIEDIRDYINKEFPEIKVGIYHSRMKDQDEKLAAMDCDLIISTAKSLGVGADIPNLRVVINTESYKSTIITDQILGRLRKPVNGDTCYYIELVDKAFTTLRAQQKSREKLLKHLVGNVLYVKGLGLR